MIIVYFNVSHSCHFKYSHSFSIHISTLIFFFFCLNNLIFTQQHIYKLVQLICWKNYCFAFSFVVIVVCLGFIGPHHVVCRMLVAQPRTELGPWPQKHWVITTGPPGNSLAFTFEEGFHLFPSYHFLLAH